MARNAHPTISIIILTWNQCSLTLDCLASLADLNYPADRLQIIVVDNGSVDGTALAIRERYPSVSVLENGKNLGFAEGNNIGIRYALQSNTEYLMLLNNDTTIDPSMLNELLEVIEQDPTVGIVGPKMLYFEQPNIIWCAGNRIDWWLGSSIRLQAEQPDLSLDEQPQEVDFITACAICLRRSVVEQIGLLDLRFFIYYEETDWCIRARTAGWRILYVPRARLWHKVSAAMGPTSPATDYYMTRNVLLFLAKNRRGLARLCSLMLVGGRNLLAVAAYTAKSHGGRRLPNRNARLLALRDVLRGHWGKMGPDVEVVCYPSRT
ncbi:MAG: glycosyltransferase family 2 protein [Anaerolineae bacterium]|nr:glycosyltransferase family 2 protein [Anaerolineae bacterium]